MPTAPFICLWFDEPGHVAMLDRRALPTPRSVSGRRCPPGWRIVETTQPAATGSTQDGATVIAWPPFYPMDLPLTVGPGEAPVQLRVFDFSPADHVSDRLCNVSRFRLDPSLSVGTANGWWVVPLLDFEDPWNPGLFGAAVEISRHAFLEDSRDISVEDIVAEALAVIPDMAIAERCLVAPTADDRVGPCALVNRQRLHSEPIVDIVMEGRPDGFLQPVVTLYAAPGSTLDDAATGIRCGVLRRNGGAFDMDDMAWSRIPQDAYVPRAQRMVVTLPEPVFHGDVIAIASHGGRFSLAPSLGSKDVIETWGTARVAFFVRREETVSAAAQDQWLSRSDGLQSLRASVASSDDTTTIDHVFRSMKWYLADSLKKAGIATSYLLPHHLGVSARAKLARQLEDAQATDLAHLAYAAADPRRMEELLRAGQPFDQPWRHQPNGVDDAVLTRCIAEIADLAGALQHEIGDEIYSVLEDYAALQAVINASTRSAATDEIRRLVEATDD